MLHAKPKECQDAILFNKLECPAGIAGEKTYGKYLKENRLCAFELNFAALYATL
jgi:hypothetical protein